MKPQISGLFGAIAQAKASGDAAIGWGSLRGARFIAVAVLGVCCDVSLVFFEGIPFIFDFLQGVSLRFCLQLLSGANFGDL